MMTKISRGSALILLSASSLACGDGASGPDAGGFEDGARSTSDAFVEGDASVVDCEADHQESLESLNDGIVDERSQVEPTHQVLSAQTNFSICGEINPAQAAGDYADVDVYEFSVTGDQNLRLHVYSEGGEDLAGLQIILFGAEGPSTIASAHLQGQNALIMRTLSAGTYWVAALAPTPASPSAVDYRIEVSKAPVACAESDAPVGFSESGDGSDNRGNDVLTIDYDVSAAFSLTASDSDSPESSSLLVLPGQSLHMQGIAANVDASGDYLDRDTYAFRTGPDTTELAMRLSWEEQSGVDLDMHLFEAGDPSVDLSFRGAARIGASGTELTSVAVLPDQDYWLWVGMYDGPGEQAAPQDYRVSLCGHAF